MMLSYSSILIAVAQCVAMLVCLEVGYRLGRYHRRDGKPHDEVSVVEGAIFALFGLLLAFAFAGSLARLDTRRELIVHETNAIGTAYLRIDLLPAAEQTDMRDLFHRYLNARLRVYDDIDAGLDMAPAMAEATGLQQQIWAKAIEASRQDSTRDISRLMLPALNEMIDVTTARAVALNTHLPGLILMLLLGLALLGSVLAGHALAKHERRTFMHSLVFAVTISLTIYTVLDLDDPRRGLVRLDAAEQALRQLQSEI